jgi:hypothetical protein
MAKKKKAEVSATGTRQILEDVLGRGFLEGKAKERVTLSHDEKKILYKEVKEGLQSVRKESLAEIDKGTFKDQRAYASAFIMYLRGADYKEIADVFGVHYSAVSRAAKTCRWDQIAAEVRTAVTQGIASHMIEMEIERGTKIIDLLRPVTIELSGLAMDALKDPELSAKDVLKLFADYAKLTGEYSGEFKNVQEVKHSVDQVYSQVMNMNPSEQIDTGKFEAELLEEPKLLE